MKASSLASLLTLFHKRENGGRTSISIQHRFKNPLQQQSQWQKVLEMLRTHKLQFSTRPSSPCQFSAGHHVTRNAFCRRCWLAAITSQTASAAQRRDCLCTIISLGVGKRTPFDMYDPLPVVPENHIRRFTTFFFYHDPLAFLLLFIVGLIYYGSRSAAEYLHRRALFRGEL